MSLYHYVQSRHDLVSLMGEAMMAETLIPADEVPDGWREGLAEIGRRTHGLFVNHPWLMSSWNQEGRGDPGISLLNHIEQTLAVVAELDFLSVGERLHLTGLVDEFVVGHSLRGDPIADAEDDTWERFVRDAAVSGDFPHIGEAFANDRPTHFGDFESSLQILLDGIAAYVERRRP